MPMPAHTKSDQSDHLSPTARRLLAARFWRSIAQGALAVDLALYLHALGWTGTAIGAVLSGAGLTGAALNLVIGVTSDRLRRKLFLLAYEGVTCVCAIIALLTTQTVILSVVIVLAGFGRGASGAAGPFSPAEQAWLAEVVESARRGLVYSLNMTLGFSGMAGGALAAALPALWRHSLGLAGSYRPLFGIVLLGNVINFTLLLGAKESRRTRAISKAKRETSSALASIRKKENRFLRDLMGLNALNGLAVGLIGPLMAYWFQQRFHVGPESIAPVMALAFMVTAGAALYAGRLTRRAGLVRVVVWGRTGGFLALLLLPLMPIYWLAAAIHILRSALNRGTVGARQALVVSAVRDERRGLATSLNALSGQVPQSIGPVIAGAFIGGGWFVAPFFMAAALQSLYVLFYQRIFGPQEEEIMKSTAPNDAGGSCQKI